MFEGAAMRAFVAVIISLLLIQGCASSLKGDVYSRNEAQKTLAFRWGTVESTKPVVIEGDRSEKGLLAGGLIGGLAGSGVTDSRTQGLVTVVGAVAGAVAYTGSVATFTPAASLAYSSIYRATITTGAKNLGGASLLNNYVWTFTTITPPPAVTAVVPANGATSVPIGQAVLSATFSEGMNPATITATTFTVTGPGGAAVAGAVTYNVSESDAEPSAPR